MTRGVSDTGVPPDAEAGGYLDYPWTDLLKERESDERSSVEIQQSDQKVQFNKVTVYVSDTSMVHSGTDGRNSDIGTLSDFSDSDEETEVGLSNTRLSMSGTYHIYGMGLGRHDRNG